MSPHLTELEKHQLLVEWNNTSSDFPRDQCVHQLFEAQAASTPDAIALVFATQQLTYFALNQRANQVAQYLRNMGVGPEVLVGIYIERSFEMIVGLLGILKAGGAYVPLDPTYPRDRLQFMLEDTQLQIILTLAKFATPLANLSQHLVKHIVPIEQIYDFKEDTQLPCLTSAENLAYVMFTSGSTGTPKGVCIVHRGIVRLVKNTNYVDFNQNDTFLQFAPISFDTATFEIWGCLLNGGRLIIMPAHVPSLAELGQVIQTYQVTTLWLIYNLFNLMVDEQLDSLKSVRQLLSGGDIPSLWHIRRLLETLPAVQFIHCYGPTENTTFTTCHLIRLTDLNYSTIPIGRPIANTQLYILDEQLQSVGIGEIGELYIGGEGLARGYFHRPELTSQKFISNPYNTTDRLYKTGDLARYLPSGNVEFVGRVDRQIKIRGFRVELEEIETTLRQNSIVKEAVIVVDEHNHDKRLVAYIISNLNIKRLPLNVGCLVEFEGEKPLALTTEDISCHGICLVGISTVYPIGRAVSLQLYPPERDTPLQLVGKVAWCKSQRVGICLETSKETYETLCETVDYLLNTKGFMKAMRRMTVEHIRDFLAEKLPAYMIPTSYIFVDKFPLTESGKIDRQALAQIDTHPLDYLELEEITVPETPTQVVLTSIWKEVFKTEKIGIDSDFITLGGHSLLAIQIIARVRQAFHVNLSLNSLFTYSTVAKLAEHIETLGQNRRIPSIQATIAHEIAPLSYPQQQLWLLTQLYPEAPIYNEPCTIYLGGPIDIPALESGLNEILRRHEALRTTFSIDDDNTPVQHITPFVEYSLPFISLLDLPISQRETEALRLATEIAKKPLDLAQYPLFHFVLVQLSEQDFRLFLLFHHIIFDGTSLYSIILPELETFYQAFSHNQTVTIARPSLRYIDFAMWQRQWLTETTLQESLAYWQQQLANLPRLRLPTDYPRPPTTTFQGARYCLALSPKLSDAIRKLAQRMEATLFMTLLTAFSILLYRYTKQEDIAIGTVTAGRHQPEIESLVGNFLNTLVLRIDLSKQPTFQTLLKRVKQVNLAAYAHQEVPFEQVVNAVHPRRHSTYTPLFNVAFILETPLPTTLDWTLTQLDIHTGATKFDLTMELDDRPEGIIGRIEYSTELFAKETIVRMLGHFQTLLEGIVKHPTQFIETLPLLTQAEQRQFALWNLTTKPFPHQQCIHHLFEAQVARTPSAIALMYQDEQITYQTLNTRANQLAHFLLKQGVKVETFVGICVERSVEMIVGLLAILKAGATYVPLDPAYPRARLLWIVQDAHIETLLTQSHLISLFADHSLPHLITFEQEGHSIAQESQENPNVTVNSRNLAYMIYTSGSTGTPKGTLIEHRGVCNLAIAQAEHFNIQANSRVLQFASTSFDASVSEIFMTLTVGATLCIEKQDHLLPGLALLEVLEKRAITAVTLPPSILAALPYTDLPTLQTIIVAGETCPLALAQQWARGRRFFNAYGPTEATVCSSVYQYSDECREMLPIGRAIANVQLYVLDEQLQQQPIGILGELYIGGVGIARGYFQRPELTQERFIVNPFTHESESYLYKTGDLVKCLPSGHLVFLGRLDEQIKFHGFRIELGEIEAVLQQHPAVKTAIVIVQQEQLPDKAIIAYIIPKASQTITITELRAVIKEQLPHYMLPSAFVVLDTLPLTHNGKIDRNALPKLTSLRQTTETHYSAPQTELEHVIATIWQDTLQIEKVSVHDNFFDLGGNSLSLAQIQTKLQTALQQAILAVDLFKYPTIYDLTTYLTQNNNSSHHVEVLLNN